MITTTTASCVSVIYDICSCKSHHQSWSYDGVIYNYICHVLLKYKGRRFRDHDHDGLLYFSNI
jgi:hypothetical protein